MTEFTVEAVRLGFVALYVGAFLGVLAALGRTPRALRTYGYPLAAVVALAPVVILLEEFGLGQVAVGAGEISAGAVVRNLFTYVVVYGGVATLAGASRRLTAGIVAVALTPILATNVAPALGAGALALGVLAAITLPYPVLLYLFLGPAWRAAEDVSARRRLLHWKTRNVLLFVYTMILLFVFVVLAELVVDPVLTEFLFRYSIFWFQAGIPVFLVYKFVRMDADEAAELSANLARFGERAATAGDAPG